MSNATLALIVALSIAPTLVELVRAAPPGGPPSPTSLELYYSALKNEKNITPEKIQELKRKVFAPAHQSEQRQFFQDIQDQQGKAKKDLLEETRKWKIHFEKEKIRQKYSQPITIRPSGRPPVVINPLDLPAVSKGRKARTASPKPLPSAQAGRKKGASPTPAPGKAGEEVVLDGSQIPESIDFKKGATAEPPAEPSPSPGPAVSGVPDVEEMHFDKRPEAESSPPVASPKARR